MHICIYIYIYTYKYTYTVAVKNTYTTGTCAGNTGDTLSVVPSTILSAQSVATTVYLYTPPYYAVAPPYPSCLDAEYVTSGRVPGGVTTVAVDLSQGVAGSPITSTAYVSG